MCIRDRNDPEAEEAEDAPQDAEMERDLRAEIERTKEENQALQSEIDQLKRDKEGQESAQVTTGLGAEFDFGERAYQCKIKSPGVGYRNSPQFGDKNPNGTGPQAPQYIVADAIVQGRRACFVRDKRNGLWLPLTNPDGTIVCMEHLGRMDDANNEAIQALDPALEAVGKNKLTKDPDAWFSPKQD
eukprot:TRINITY_DN281_c0_g1_i2.p2 TRINITY_DN281_c0_g1~~TRINITY_DN281_c0_g1_i2.p2  ORF type:complete len:186 (+),score=65.45 TRINITY_DN281_c0_g1_i2:76-633(+)